MDDNLANMYPLEFGNEWDNEEYDDWSEDEEEELILNGICPECGADLDLCGHGIDLYEEDDDGLFVDSDD
jgi:hypothetical protein